jgi:hypothetical protein
MDIVLRVVNCFEPFQKANFVQDTLQKLLVSIPAQLIADEVEMLSSLVPVLEQV